MHIGVLLIQSASFIHLVCRCASLSTTFCLVPVDDMVLFHGMVCDGRRPTCELHCSPFSWRQAVNNQDVIKMSDVHRNVVIR